MSKVTIENLNNNAVVPFVTEEDYEPDYAEGLSRLPVKRLKAFLHKVGILGPEPSPEESERFLLFGNTATEKAEDIGDSVIEEAFKGWIF